MESYTEEELLCGRPNLLSMVDKIRDDLVDDGDNDLEGKIWILSHYFYLFDVFCPLLHYNIINNSRYGYHIFPAFVCALYFLVCHLLLFTFLFI